MSKIEKLNMIAEWQEQHKQLIEDLNNSKKQIAELEKENIELKKKVLEIGQHLDLTEREWGKDTTKLIHFKTQLTKAKDILRMIVYWTKEQSNNKELSNFIDKAEQFISEVEK